MRLYAPNRRLTGSALTFLSSVLSFGYHSGQAIGKLGHGAFQLTQPALYFVQVLLIRSATRSKYCVSTKVRDAAGTGLGSSTLQTGEFLLGEPDVHKSGTGFLYGHKGFCLPGIFLLENLWMYRTLKKFCISTDICHANALKRTVCSADCSHLPYKCRRFVGHSFEPGSLNEPLPRQDI